MNETKNIGEWKAFLKNVNGQTKLNVNGTFPTKGEKPRFDLLKNNPQGVIASELLLTLVFGNLADLEGSENASVHFSEDIDQVDQYNSVLVVDDRGRTIARMNVTKP